MDPAGTHLLQGRAAGLLASTCHIAAQIVLAGVQSTRPSVSPGIHTLICACQRTDWHLGAPPCCCCMGSAACTAQLRRGRSILTSALPACWQHALQHTCIAAQSPPSLVRSTSHRSLQFLLPLCFSRQLCHTLLGSTCRHACMHVYTPADNMYPIHCQVNIAGSPCHLSCSGAATGVGAGLLFEQDSIPA